MITRNTLLVFFLGCSFSANAEIVTITRAHEIAISDLRLPASTSGAVSFQECVNCDTQTIRVSTETHYVLDGDYLALKEFKSEIRNTRNRDSIIATIMHQLEKDWVVAILVNRK
jgi:hypothetical protein